MNSEDDINDELVLPLKDLLSEALPPAVYSKLGKYEFDKGVIRIWFKSTDSEKNPFSPEYLGGNENFGKLVGFIILTLNGEFVDAGEDSHIKILDMNNGWLPKHPFYLGMLDKLREVKNWEVAGRYEEAAQFYEWLGLHEKAGELRRMEKTQYVISTKFQLGKDGLIKIECPHCGASQPAESKSSEVVCRYCEKRYIIPKRILDMI